MKTYKIVMTVANPGAPKYSRIYAKNLSAEAARSIVDAMYGYTWCFCEEAQKNALWEFSIVPETLKEKIQNLFRR